MKTPLLALAAVALIACAPSQGNVTGADLQRQLSLRGRPDDVKAALSKLDATPHLWMRGSPIPEGRGYIKVLIKWSVEPTYREIGSIVFTAQSNHLTIGDTDLVKAPK